MPSLVKFEPENSTAADIAIFNPCLRLAKKNMMTSMFQHCYVSKSLFKNRGGGGGIWLVVGWLVGWHSSLCAWLDN